MGRTFSVLTCLPGDGDRVLCFGHKTFCCKEDMDAEPGWYEVTFSFSICSYKLKDKMPDDLEDSVLSWVQVIELWEIIADDSDEHVVGVTEWRGIP